MSELEPGQQLVGRGPSAATMERVADDIWLMRGGASPPLVPHRIMNVYFIEEGDGVTVFDAGVRAMAPHIEHVGQRMGGIKRIVLGHAHPDHRGAAARVNAPVWCHEDEVEYAEAENPQPYFDYEKLPVARPAGRYVQKMLLAHAWDAGPVRIERRLKEGDTVAGFEVVHVPGHAPGQIALWRERDRLALTTDTFYMLNVLTAEASPPVVPLDAYNLDTNQAKASVKKLADLDPAVCWPGHVGPAKDDVKAQLERAAEG